MQHSLQDLKHRWNVSESSSSPIFYCFPYLACCDSSSSARTDHIWHGSSSVPHHQSWGRWLLSCGRIYSAAGTSSQEDAALANSSGLTLCCFSSLREGYFLLFACCFFPLIISLLLLSLLLCLSRPFTIDLAFFGCLLGSPCSWLFACSLRAWCSPGDPLRRYRGSFCFPCLSLFTRPFCLFCGQVRGLMFEHFKAENQFHQSVILRALCNWIARRRRFAPSLPFLFVPLPVLSCPFLPTSSFPPFFSFFLLSLPPSFPSPCLAPFLTLFLPNSLPCFVFSSFFSFSYSPFLSALLLLFFPASVLPSSLPLFFFPTLVLCSLSSIPLPFSPFPPAFFFLALGVSVFVQFPSGARLAGARPRCSNSRDRGLESSRSHCCKQRE